MELLKLRKIACDFADKKVHGIKEEHWTKMSNCTEWTVKQLVNHIVNENYWEPDLLAGKTIADVGTKYDGDLVGNAPTEVWEKSIKEADTYIAGHPDSLHMKVHLSYGEVPASEYMSQRILDLAIHGWDVAKSTGQDLAIPPELVTYLWDTFSPQKKTLSDTGLFGHEIEVPDTADPQTKLLALLGRT